ncbi:MAG: MFS transporter [Chitinophagaceae bacterium]|nr:MFS transporter [Chitinophagaceae bacterium]
MKQAKLTISLFLNYFIFAILLNSVGTVILQVQKNFGVSETGASVLEGFKDLSIAISSFLIASFIVRIGYKRAMQLALLMVTLMCLLMPSIPAFWSVKLLFACIGVGFALIKITVFATIGLLVNNEKEHSSFMNYLESFFMIGVLTGGFIFAYFVDDTNPLSTEWFKVYYLLGGLSLLALILLSSSIIDESSIASAKQRRLSNDFVDMIKLIGLPVVLVFIVNAFLYVLIEQSIMSWLPTFNNKVLQLPTALSIQMATILAASTALGRFTAGVVLKKINWYLVVVVCLIVAAGLVLVSMPMANAAKGKPVTGWSDAPLVAYLFPFIGFLLAPIYPAINSVILSTLPKEKHAPMSGLIVVFSALGGTTGSIITGTVFHHFDGQTAFYFSLIPIGILIVFLTLFRSIRNKMTV